MSDQGQPPVPTPPPPPSGTPPVPPTPTPPAPVPPPPDNRSDLDKLAAWANSWGAKEKQEGRAQVERDVAEQLGMTLSEAKGFIDKAKEAQLANLSEAEQKLVKAEEKNTETRQMREAANAVIKDSIAQDSLMDLGMSREGAKQYASLLQVQFDSKMDDEAKVAAIVQSASQFKTMYPDLFAVGSGNGRQGPTDSATRGGQPSAGQGGETPRDRAIARLRKEQGGRLKTDLPQPPEMDYTRRSV